jgi:hypothetical protein
MSSTSIATALPQFDLARLLGISRQQRLPPPHATSAGRVASDTFSKVGGNSPATATVRKLGPTTNPKYQPRNGNTYCNVFTHDYMRARGLSEKQFPLQLANDTNKWLKSSSAAKQGWKQVSAEEAQRFVNNGGIGLVSRLNRGGHGHIAPILEGQTQGGYPAISNVGSRNFLSGHAGDSPAFRAGPTSYWIKT